MDNTEIQKQFSYFLHECINLKSAEKYIAALKKVSVTLNKIVPEVNSIWEINTLHDAETYRDLIYNDPDFVEYNNDRGNNMYSAAYNWFINFLKTKEYFYAVCYSEKQKVNQSSPIESQLQMIFYGAPGTGKSFKIDSLTNDDNTIRTTFHPDSDYASFVGAYKPTMENVPISAVVSTNVYLANPQGGHSGKEKKIVYKFVPQAFLKAYVAAWKDLAHPHFLVIEEINRGNCAQIFGDLFQLLDRNSSGSSSYAIHADDDIAKFLREDEKGFGALTEEEKDAIRSFILKKGSGKTEAIGESILSGKKLLLPPNLYIWATMNTSDQSLFPIDSAFKRRWEWEYVPIDYEVKDWQFEIAGKQYLWSDFLKKINPLIFSITQSSDKQMGYFFAKPDKKTDPSQTENNLISEKVFLNKVLFYLWTDVLKDYEPNEEIFRDSETKQTYLFADFFPTTNGKLAEFVEKLELPIIGMHAGASSENS